MIRVLYWIKDYWYIPLLVIGLLLLWIFVGTWSPPKDPEEKRKLRRELDTINAGSDARRLKAQVGAEAATEGILRRYQVEKEALDDQEQDRIETLEADPVALARHLERLSR